MDAKALCDLSDNLFGKKMPLISLQQEIAENFYPERADFTVRRSPGTDFAANLMTSYPVLCRRDLADQFSTMLRPTAKPWFHIGVKYEEKDEDETEENQYTQWFEETMRRAMYDPLAMFNKSTKQGDNDFAAFGQCAISVELTTGPKGPQLLYRTWHLRDMAWQENQTGQIGAVFRRWKPTVQTACRMFPNIDDKVHKTCEKDPFAEIELLHMVIEADMYDKGTNKPRWSIWYDRENQKVLQETPIYGKHYVIPRWQTVSSTLFGSQYAYSPAVVAALPDARLIQAMTYTLLEAGEKATSPPIIATQDAVRSDVALYAGGITWVDQEYDERLGDALRPLTQDFRGFNFGIELTQSAQVMIKKAFYLDALTLPQRAPEMTAYEVGQRIQEYIRNALPLFEPVETEYNAAICEETFDLLKRGGAFGSPLDWPKDLRGAEMDFTFESPLHDTIEEQKAQKIVNVQPLISSVLPLDPSAAYIVDASTALRDALSGTLPAKWLRSEVKVKDMVEVAAKKQQEVQTLAAMQQGSEVAKNIGAAQASAAQAQGMM